MAGRSLPPLAARDLAHLTRAARTGRAGRAGRTGRTGRTGPDSQVRVPSLAQSGAPGDGPLVPWKGPLVPA